MERTLYSFSRPSNCGVKPHLDAVFTTSTTLPFRLARSNSLPFSAADSQPQHTTPPHPQRLHLLSLGLKSKNVVADAIVLYCLGRICC